MSVITIEKNASKGSKRSRKRFARLDIFLVLAFLCGFGVLVYPPVANFWNSLQQGKAIAVYNDAVSSMAPADFAAEWARVDAYNRALSQSRRLNLRPSEAEITEYKTLLDPANNGVMGHIEINKIGVDLPIYHTVDDSVLAVGVGHIPGTSLPGGGESTHTVFSGHRGLPSSKLFTDLDRVEEGDIFILHVMDRVLYYQVDQIRIVEPQGIDDLEIMPGKDYVTLVTCTPYAINTHRLLVRGHRVAFSPQGYVPADAVVMDSVLVSMFMTIPLFTVGCVAYITARRRRKTRRKLVIARRAEAGQPATKFWRGFRRHDG